MNSAIKDALAGHAGAAETLRSEMIQFAANEVYAETLLIASDVSEFKDAMQADRDGEDALHTVEDRLAAWLARNPAAIDVMRASVEWDPAVRTGASQIAALAVVNEALNRYLDDMASRWMDRPAQPGGPQ